MMSKPIRISTIDSHTAGEPTRTVVGGFPGLGSGSPAEVLSRFRESFDPFRSAIVCEPRGHDAIVGALLLEPTSEKYACGIIFFNNVSYLGMCGHGTIGVVRTLEHMGLIGPGRHQIETPVGDVTAFLDGDGQVTVENVPSYRLRKGVEVNVPGYSTVTGDIAWGGNWFFLINDHDNVLELENLDSLLRYTSLVRDRLAAEKITGEGGAEIDHIELFSQSKTCNSKNFVLCPGREYDRSPCGTGTSAKLACLYEDGKLEEGEWWSQESIIGSVFEGSIRIEDNRIIPLIRGTAFVTSESELVLDERDPFCFGTDLKF